MNSRQRNLGKGREYILGLLKFRQRSEKELRDKLKNKGYPLEAINELTDYFKRSGYINDREFARAWLNARLAKPLGLRLILRELRQKGIDERIIAGVIEESRSLLNEDNAVQELAQRRYEFLKKKNQPVPKIKANIYAYLIRRGFAPETVRDALNKIDSDNEY